MTGAVPSPLFDTQIAAMVCGFGESVGYENLVRKIAGQGLDKSVQFTDWSRRPLSARHLNYALGDVTHLADIYIHLRDSLEEAGRGHWLESENAVLADPATYETDPRASWKRIKFRGGKPITFAALQELAAWRELEAQRRDQPKSWVIRDDALVDIAVHMPASEKELAANRGMNADMARGRIGQDILEILARVRALPKSDYPPRPDKKEPLPHELTPALEMLRMLLRINCAENEVAPKMIASAADLEELARSDDADIPALRGWRNEVFGKEALALKRGEISLALKDGQVVKTGV
jgi:ribonuclease D